MAKKKKANQRGGARPGAGRPLGPGGPKRKVAWSITEATANRIDTIAKRNDVSRAAVIEAVLSAAPLSFKVKKP